MSRRTLFVSGFSHRTRARDLAYEFERYGPLVRCDIPALRNESSKPYAFVEFEDDRDAREAYHEMRDVRFEGYRLDVQFAKNAPSASWRYERGGARGRSRSPRRGRSPPRRRSPRRSPSPPPRRHSISARDRSSSPRGRRPRSPSPGTGHRRSSSRSPVHGEDREMAEPDGDQAGSPMRSRSPERRLSGDGGHGNERADDARSPSDSPRRRSISAGARSASP
ncbi:hypothetical protein B0O80DRAFT_440257 [Mortierella sp. GBAus27b]|nr:hypothetical protein B0O80DRAFT_440257 [Mortierella sp. GBAus27b]